MILGTRSDGDKCSWAPRGYYAILPPQISCDCLALQRYVISAVAEVAKLGAYQRFPVFPNSGEFGYFAQ